MNIYINPEQNSWETILKRPLYNFAGLYPKVQEVLNEVKMEGDTALNKFSRLYDGVVPERLQVDPADIEESGKYLDENLKKAMQQAAKNISEFHSMQNAGIRKMEITPGVVCWQKPVPIVNVGLYIPGGSAPLFSTVLMLAIPAKIAGCQNIILCTPPGKEGIHPAILYAAKIAGVDKVYNLGGIQAIGAMAFGTQTIPKVDKIFGPGNQYVTAAKQLVGMNDVAIDLPAGPSEVMVVADKSSNPAYIAADLLSQAEHGSDSQVVLLASDKEIVDKTEQEIKLQVNQLPRKEIVIKALSNSVAIVEEDELKQIDIINTYAPEHLILCNSGYLDMSEKIINAGSVFLGMYTPESAGDYASGTNHTLPTNGWARSFSGVNLDSFVRKITFQELSREGLTNIGPAIETMAAAEMLEAHKNAVSIRLAK